MFPYLAPGTIEVGGVTLTAFQVTGIGGFLIATALSVYFAPERGLERRAALLLLGQVAICAILGAHVFALAFYHREQLLAAPVHQVFRVFRGLASLGGVLGGVLGALLFARMSGRSLRVALDVVIMGLPAGWSVGRTTSVTTRRTTPAPSAWAPWSTSNRS